MEELNLVAIETWVYLGGFRFQPPKWICSHYKSLKLHKNAPKIDGNPKIRKKNPKPFLAKSLHRDMVKSLVTTAHSLNIHGRCFHDQDVRGIDCDEDRD